MERTSQPIISFERCRQPMLRILCHAFIVASATMSYKKRPNSSSADKKSTKVPLAPPAPAKTPAPDEQADGSPKPTDTNADKSGKSAKGSHNGGKPAQVSAPKPGARTLRQAQGGPWGTSTSADARSGGANDLAGASVRSYSIPDYRLE